MLCSASCRAAPGSGSARWPSLCPGTYRLADDQVAGEGDASREDGGRHGDVEAEVKQHVPALPRDENGAGRGIMGAMSSMRESHSSRPHKSCLRCSGGMLRPSLSLARQRSVADSEAQKCTRVGKGLVVAAGSVSVTGLAARSHWCWDAEEGTAGAGPELRAALLLPRLWAGPAFAWAAASFHREMWAGSAAQLCGCLLH